MVNFRYRTLVILTVISSLLLSFTASAANLTATVSSNKVTQAEVFQLRLTYDAKVDSDSLDFTRLEDSFFLGQPSFGSSLNYINGKRSSRSEWTIALKAKKLGTLTIPAFTVEGAQSQPINILVSQDKDLPQANELVEVQSQLAKEVLYPNEMTQLKTRLIIKSDPRRLQNVKITPPSGADFSIKQIGQPNQYQTVINGVEATIIDQSFNVTAQAAGNKNLNSVGFSATFVFGNNRSGTTKLLPVQIAPEQLNVEVKPRPSKSGEFWLPTPQLQLSQSWLDSEGKVLANDTQQLSVKLGDSITRQITLTIAGVDAENFPQIITDYPQAVRQYSEKPQFKQLQDGQTQMTIQQVLIAQQQGVASLPAISVNWFNTATGNEQLSQVKGLDIDVQPTDNLVPSQATFTTNTPPQVIKDAGYWPYFTALFASLWLITFIWHIKSRLSQPNESLKQANAVDTTQQLISAIKTEDMVKAQYLLKTWLVSQAGKDAALQTRIVTAIQAMIAAQYSGKDQSCDKSELISMIKQLNKLRVTASNTGNLPKL
ncbi:BatD family protein [Vibrio rhodolitus]|uniref:BatD family protein n=1 Tax=Vibrio rhodolitus TaxID=2231649 RepID=UPI000E0C95C9|nr:BatD family protein [Vibrio rhodolitus]